MDHVENPRGEIELEPTGTQSIGRAVALLRLVAGHGAAGAGLAALVDASGLTKPTCRRILIGLMDAGLAEQDPLTRRYFLGPETYVLGTLAAERFGIHRLGLEGATRLAQDTGDAAFIQVRRDWVVICLHREDGPYPIRSHVLAAGDRHPLGAGAGGIALLAALPDAEVEQALQANAGLLAERYPMLTRPVLDNLVGEARDKGYGFNRGLLFPGSWGIGMVVRDAQGRPDGCLSLAAIESRMQPDREAYLVQLLQTEVRRLEARLKDFATKGETRTATVSPAHAAQRRPNERR
ncbi:IclR family transcriptional regulator [Phreatobacter stygius]|uniref:IclR family transcriptional regulator n=1 Tax=Phreatobacter stygius TaxID=1940610 RepID=A0A4D7AZL7_9HYPH|nr:IclR family transcriptional regulator [Phreatobacter stygius]QCI66799.1 IclR family transcriptional regulator [Phreatobacter stygius]